MEFLILQIVLDIIVIIFIASDAPKRGMSSAWAFLGIFFLLGLIIYLIARKPLLSVNSNNIQQVTVNTTPLVIPDSCPQCHNPNTRKTRLCEWCGAKIC